MNLTPDQSITGVPGGAPFQGAAQDPFTDKPYTENQLLVAICILLNAISQGGGGGGPVTIADAADVALGSKEDLAIAGDLDGTLNAHLRGLLKTFGIQADLAAGSDTATASFMSLTKRLLEHLTTINDSQKSGIQVTTDLDTAISKGMIVGASVKVFSGYNPTSSTTEESISSMSVQVSYPSTAQPCTVSSTNANDNSAGTGARTVRITGLDTSFNVITETVTLNGQTGVPLVNTYRRIEKIEVLTAGSGNVNAGIIYVGYGTVTAGVPASRLRSMEVGANVSDGCFYTVPFGKRARLKHTDAMTSGANDNIRLYYRPSGGALFYRIKNDQVDSGVDLDDIFYAQLIFSAGTDIELRCITGTGTSIVSGQIQVIEENA